MRILLQPTKEVLTADMFLSLLRIKYSNTHSNRRDQEELVMASFKTVLFKIEDGELGDFLNQLEEGMVTSAMRDFASQLQISNILAFVTGAATRPVTGFAPRPSIAFVHDICKHHPSAQTCSNELQLFVNPPNQNVKEMAFYLLTSLMNGSVFSTI
ncbi:uncharacterized protein [Amphiura filiformis]|uniref:uncharacterized protein n=1 Tax=Amphiura filiformis TaxID=82378 RepID=UPI003B20C757